MSEWKLPEIDLKKCTGCGNCARECPEQALVILSGVPTFSENNLCSYCTHCEAVCPEQAIQCPLEIGWA